MGFAFGQANSEPNIMYILEFLFWEMEKRAKREHKKEPKRAATLVSGTPGKSLSAVHHFHFLVMSAESIAAHFTTSW
jgi:hypothetical protein